MKRPKLLLGIGFALCAGFGLLAFLTLTSKSRQTKEIVREIDTSPFAELLDNHLEDSIPGVSINCGTVTRVLLVADTRKPDDIRSYYDNQFTKLGWQQRSSDRSNTYYVTDDAKITITIFENANPLSSNENLTAQEFEALQEQGMTMYSLSVSVKSTNRCENVW